MIEWKHTSIGTRAGFSISTASARLLEGAIGQGRYSIIRKLLTLRRGPAWGWGGIHAGPMLT